MHAAWFRGVGLAEEMLQGMRPVGHQLEHSVEEIARKPAGKSPQVAKQLPRRVGVGQRSMGIGMRQAELPGEMRQAVAGRHRQHDPRQVEGVEQFVPGSGLAIDQEGQIERATMRDDGAVTDEVDDLRQHLLGRWRGRHIVVTDPGQFLDRTGDRHFGPRQGLKGRQHLVAAKPNGANLDDAVESRRQPGRLQIERHERAIH